MTNIKVRVQRKGSWANVDVDQLTDAELDELIAQEISLGHGGWRWFRVLARWIRDHFKETPQMSAQITVVEPVPDGGDCTPAIQTAIIAATAAGGGIIQLTKGEYPITNLIIRAPAIILRGIDRDSTILRRTSTAPGALVTFYGATSGCKLQDLLLAGPYQPFGSLSDPAVKGVYISAPGVTWSDIDLVDMAIRGCTTAIHKSTNALTGNSDRLTVQRCDIQGYTGIVYPHQGTLHLSETTIRGFGVPRSNQAHGAYVYPDVSLDISDCEFKDACPTAIGFGVHVFDQQWREGDLVSRYCQVTRSTFDSSVCRGVLTWSAPAVITDCQFLTRGPAVQVGRCAAIVSCRFASATATVELYPGYPFIRQGYSIVNFGPPTLQDAS